MYELIAAEYSTLFPLDPGRLELLGRWQTEHRCRVLDIGAADGAFALALAEAGCTVTAFEPDAALRHEARRRFKTAGETGSHISLRAEGMLDLDETGAYDGIFCLGNTLPHLADEAAVADFLGRVRRALVSGGRVAVQMLNYGAILAAGAWNPPPLETPRLRFERRYRDLSPEAVTFEITATALPAGRPQRASTRLFPLTWERLAALASEAGLKEGTWYADYALNPAQGDEPHGLFIARRG